MQNNNAYKIKFSRYYGVFAIFNVTVLLSYHKDKEDLEDLGSMISLLQSREFNTRALRT